MKQEIFSALLCISNAERAIPATARRKKSRKPFSDFLLGVPLHGDGYSVVNGGDTLSMRNLNIAFRSVSVM